MHHHSLGRRSRTRVSGFHHNLVHDRLHVSVVELEVVPPRADEVVNEAGGAVGAAGCARERVGPRRVPCDDAWQLLQVRGRLPVRVGWGGVSGVVVRAFTFQAGGGLPGDAGATDGTERGRPDRVVEVLL